MSASVPDPLRGPRLARAAGALLSALALFLAGCADPRSGVASDPAALAEPVEVARLELEDALRPRRIPLRIAWPRARRGALPLVIFSHGAYSSRDDYSPILDRWAARGYVVVAVTHVDSVALGAERGKPTPGAWSSRVADVRFVLDHPDLLAAAVPALRGRLDAARVALAGHSLGGLVAQAFGGMTGTDPDTHVRYALRDPRVRAVVALSGMGALPPLVTAQDFRGLALPLFVSVGTADLAMPMRPEKSGLELRREPFDLAPAGRKYLLVLAGADHYLGGIVGRDNLAHAADAPLFLEAFAQTSGVFLDAFLRGDPGARRRLGPLAVPATARGVATLTGG